METKDVQRDVGDESVRSWRRRIGDVGVELEFINGDEWRRLRMRIGGGGVTLGATETETRRWSETLDVAAAAATTLETRIHKSELGGDGGDDVEFELETLGATSGDGRVSSGVRSVTLVEKMKK